MGSPTKKWSPLSIQEQHAALAATNAVSLAAESAWTDPAQLWGAVSALNLISAVIILHAVVWRRWPVSVDES